jgi:hypothetical protein
VAERPLALPPAQQESANMAHYYFDLREGDELITDEEGLELRDLKVMQKEAARALAGFARDSVQSLNDVQSHQMAIAVRDEHGPVMEVKFSFEIVRKQ